MRYIPLLITSNNYAIFFEVETQGLYKSYIGDNRYNFLWLYLSVAIAISGFNILNITFKNLIDNYLAFVIYSNIIAFVVSYFVSEYILIKIDNLKMLPVYDEVEDLNLKAKKRLFNLFYTNIAFLILYLLIIYISVINKDFRLIFSSWLSLMALIILYRASFLVEIYRYLESNKSSHKI
ncbi:hypothetical protein [Glaesserella sp.]|uniref:hypothetical protein n=1 Tax=Glaesserella sp. TaxID=2094731 RepID=UPI00359F3008